MTSLAGGEPVVEGACQILRRNADAAVRDTYFHAVLGTDYAHRDPSVSSSRIHTGALGVRHEVDENLQRLVLVNVDYRSVFVRTDDLDPVPTQRSRAQPQTVLHEVGRLDLFPHA